MRGDTIPPLPKDTTNVWFIATCVTRGNRVHIDNTIFVTDSPAGPAPFVKEYERVNNEETKPLFQTMRIKVKLMLM